ncbi:hypothetical protein WN943_008893 [Citrus x changshan-huyou]
MPKVKDMYTICIRIQYASSDSDGNNEFRISVGIPVGIRNSIKKACPIWLVFYFKFRGPPCEMRKQQNKTNTVISNKRKTTPNDWLILPGKIINQDKPVVLAAVSVCASCHCILCSEETFCRRRVRQVFIAHPQKGTSLKQRASNVGLDMRLRLIQLSPNNI